MGCPSGSRDLCGTTSSLSCCDRLMRSLGCVLVGTVAAAQGGCGSGSAEPPSIQASPVALADPQFASVLSYLQGKMTADQVPGAAIAVVRDGALAFQAGIGVKQRGEPGVVQASTLFRVASLSKMVLAATAMKLVEQGKIDLSQPVTHYIPFTLRAPFDPSTISLDALLTHTSSIPDTNIEKLSCPVGFGQSAAWFALAGPVPLWSPPGSVWDYTNTEYALMGWVIESVTGRAYEDVATDLILGPAGMITATFDPAVAEAADHAVGYEGDFSLEPNAFDCSVERSPAGVIASVLDYAHFAEMLMSSGGSVLKPSSVVAMEAQRAQTDDYPGNTEQYGYGLYLHEGYVYRVWHSGNLEGYQTSIYMVPAQNWAVVVFYNSASGDPNDVSQFAVDTFLLPPTVKSPVLTTPMSTWTHYEGTYVDPYGIYENPSLALAPLLITGLGTITVSLQDGGLFAQGSGPESPSAPFQLTQVAGDRFQGNFNGGLQDVTFYPDDAGTPSWFVRGVGVGVRQ
jgi:CubicO group peptidase (beta-lactamase class C family)